MSYRLVQIWWVLCVVVPQSPPPVIIRKFESNLLNIHKHRRFPMITDDFQ